MSSQLKFFLFVVGTTGFFGGIYGSALLVFSSLLVITLIVLAHLWSEYAFVRFRVNQDLDQDRMEFGRKTYYNVELENRKLLPLLWLKIETEISRGIDFVNQEVISKSFSQKNKFHDYFSLRWYEWARRKYEIIPQQRGLYYFGGITINYSGILGLFAKREEREEFKELIVYPRIVPLTGVGIEDSQLFGSHKKEGWIYKDPLNKVGVRPYQNTDSFKEINWKASARHLTLESDIYNPSFDKEIHIFLNGPVGRAWWQGVERNKLELGIVCAASFVDYSSQKGYQIGFYSNIPAVKEQPGKYKGKGSYTTLKVSHNPRQRTRLLSVLALLQTYGIGTTSRIMEEEKQNIKTGSSVVVITPTFEEDLQRVLSYYNQYYNLLLIRIGKSTEQQKLPGIRQSFIDEEVAWDEIKTLDIG